MQEKINQLESLFKDIIRQFEYRLRIKRTSVEHYCNELTQLEKDYFEAYPNTSEEESRVIFDNLLSGFEDKKNDSSFIDQDIPRIKSLLRDTLNALDEINYVLQENGDLIPNEEFKDLIRKGILSTETTIIGQFKGKTYSGHLTEDGFFELVINGSVIPFSNFRSAAEHAWQKPMPNDCWSVWTAVDKNRESHSLKHYRQFMREQQ